MQRSRVVLLLLCCSVIERSCGFAPVHTRRAALSRRYTATFENPSVDTNDDFNLTPEYVTSNERTYYDVLGTLRTASRTELKRQYVAFARLTHPDALIGTDDGGIDRSAEFSEIAKAWKVLSHEKERRRYDRSLVAEDFKKNVAVVASGISNTAAPRVKKAFDDFAVPFFRRTTITTAATVSAAVDQITHGNGGIGSAFSSAFQAGGAASRALDGLECLEKSVALDLR